MVGLFYRHFAMESVSGPFSEMLEHSNISSLSDLCNVQFAVQHYLFILKHCLRVQYLCLDSRFHFFMVHIIMLLSGLRE